MDVKKILALSDAGFTVDEIIKIATAFDTAQGAPEPAPTEPPAPADDPAPEPAPTPEPAPAPAPSPAPEAPKWFTDFMTQYNKDYSDLNRRLVNGKVRTAEPDGPAPKSVDELMAEAYAGIR